MRVISGLGVVSGRASCICNSFSTGFVGSTLEEREQGYEDDTRLPSERMGLNKPIVAPAYPTPKRLDFGAIV